MKKVIVPFIVLILIIMNSFPVYADTNITTDTNIISELKENESLILESANKMLSSQIETAITSEDIDYDNAIKVYVDTNLLENDNLNAENLDENMADSEYIYYLPIYLNGESIYCTVVKGNEVLEETKELLEDEDVERLLSLQNKWYVAQVDIFSNDVNYKRDMEKFIKDNYLDVFNMYFVGGLSGNIPFSAVFSSENNVKFKIIDISNTDDEISEGPGDITTDKDILYSYEDIKAMASDYNLEPEQVGSGGLDMNHFNMNSIIIIVASLLIAVILLVTFLYNKKMQRSKL